MPTHMCRTRAPCAAPKKKDKEYSGDKRAKKAEDERERRLDCL